MGYSQEDSKSSDSSGRSLKKSQARADIVHILIDVEIAIEFQLCRVYAGKLSDGDIFSIYSMEENDIYKKSI